MNPLAAIFSVLGLHDVAVWLSQTPLTWPQLAEPRWLLLLVLPLVLLAWRLNARQRLLHYADAALRPWALVRQSQQESAWRRRVLWGLMVGFWLGLTFSLADPRVPKAANDQIQTRPPVLFLVDTTAAMSVADVSPNRQARAVALVGLLAKALPDRRLGLMIETDTAGLLLPPAADPTLLPFFLNQIGALQHPLVAPRPDAAFEWIAQMPPMYGGAVVWLTSGDAASFTGALGSRQLAAAEALKKADIRLIALTVAGNGGPLLKAGLPMKTAEEQIIESIPAPERVAELARLTGGFAAQTRTLPTDVTDIQKAIDALPNRPPQMNAATQTRSLYALPLLLAWLCLLTAGVLLLWRGGGTRVASSTLGLAFGVTLSIGLLQPPPANAAESQAWLNHSLNQKQIQTGDTALQRGNYAEAQVAFAAAKGFDARLGAGMAAFRRADYAYAVDQLQVAVWQAPTPMQSALAVFNLGNALTMAGRYPAALDAFNQVVSIKSLPQALSDAALINRDILQKMRQTAARNSENGQKFQGYQAATYGYYQDPSKSQMDQEIQKSSGATQGTAEVTAPASAPTTPFVLNEGTATSARAKLNLIVDAPTPLLDGLLGQQPYHRPALSDESPTTRPTVPSAGSQGSAP